MIKATGKSRHQDRDLYDLSGEGAGTKQSITQPPVLGTNVSETLLFRLSAPLRGQGPFLQHIFATARPTAFTKLGL